MDKSLGDVSGSVDMLSDVIDSNVVVTEEINASVEELNSLMHLVNEKANVMLDGSEMLSHELELFKVDE